MSQIRMRTRDDDRRVWYHTILCHVIGEARTRHWYDVIQTRASQVRSVADDHNWNGRFVGLGQGARRSEANTLSLTSATTSVRTTMLFGRRDERGTEHQQLSTTVRHHV